MSYIQLSTEQYPISLAEIVTLNPDTVPTPLDGYAWVFPTPQPTYDPIRQSVQEIAPALSVKDTWEQQWQVNELDPEQIAANEAAALLAKRTAMAVSPRQIRQAMTQAGMRDLVESAIAQGDQDDKDWYEFATAFERLHPTVLELATVLAISDEQLDDLFTLAGSL